MVANCYWSLRFRKSVIAGMTAGAFGQFIASPTDLVKVQMQMEGKRVLVEGRRPRYDFKMIIISQTFSNWTYPFDLTVKVFALEMSLLKYGNPRFVKRPVNWNQKSFPSPLSNTNFTPDFSNYPCNFTNQFLLPLEVWKIGIPLYCTVCMWPGPR